jgi:hypothetical protein
MTMKSLFCFIILTMLFVSGCAGTLQEIITCDPPQADIYWGKTESQLKKTGYKTPHSRTISGSIWESWCYQAKKEGYHDSPVICREEENHRNLEFHLVTRKTSITSDPPVAIIYWGPSKDQINRTGNTTPLTITVREHSGGASWKDWYFQVKKEGYHDSEILFLPQQPGDRSVHFELILEK